MGERADALATRFEQANADAIAAVERLSDADWGKTTGEGWTVAATAHHAAVVHEGIANRIRMMARGDAPPPLAGMESIHESNAAHAERYAACSRSEVLAVLHAAGALAAAIVRGLDDEQLNRGAVVVQGMPAMSAQQMVEMVLIGHLQEHMRSITEATAG